ncbi:MAG: hypothetical protein E7038_04360 [Lentisphaerae bacterium]|nr:hypothetical protein [Lentisphaerota bacterium]
MKKIWMNVCLVLIGSAVTLPLAAQITPITSAAPAAAPIAPIASAAAPASASVAQPAAEVPAVGTFKIRKEFAEVICAEIVADKKPVLNDVNPHDVSPYGDKTCWAQIILMLPEKRGLSRFDFVLKASGETYPCLAVALGDTVYSMKDEFWQLPAQRDPQVPVRLLFAVSPNRILGNDGSLLVPLTLERTFADVASRIGSDTVRFRLVPAAKAFMTAAEAKKFADEKGGSYGMTDAEMMARAAQPAAGTAPAGQPAAAQPASPASPATPAPAAKPAAPSTPAPVAKPAAPSTPAPIAPVAPAPAAKPAPAPAPAAKPAPVAAPSFIQF